MLATLPPRFLDSVDVHETQAQLSPTVQPVVVGPDAAARSTRDIHKLEEQQKHFTYWNWIAITRTAERAAGMEPQFSLPGSSRASRDWKQSQHLRTLYGVAQAESEALQPLPETHPLATLFAKPNPDDDWASLCEETVVHWKLSGQFVWWMIPNKIRGPQGLALPGEIYCVPPSWVHPQYDKQSRRLVSYLIRPDGDSRRDVYVLPEYLIWRKATNPRSKTEAMSPLQAGAMWVDGTESIEAARRSQFDNGCNPSVLLHLGEKYQGASKDELDEVRHRFLMRQKGLHRQGEPMTIPPGIEAKPWSTTPKEMDYGVSANQLRDNTLALHGVPPIVAGISTDYNRATASTAVAVFCDITINPLLRMLASTIQRFIGRRFYDPRILVWFDDCTPADAEQELKDQEFDFKVGALTPAQRQDYRGYEVSKESAYNSGYLQSTLVPLNDDLMPDPSPDQIDDGEDGDDDSSKLDKGTADGESQEEGEPEAGTE